MKYAHFIAVAPIKCKPLISKVAYDVDQHASNLPNSQQRYDQISAGPFYGSTTALSFEGLQVFYEFASQQLHKTCNVSSDTLWLGIAANPNTDTRIDGMTVRNNDLMCRLGHQKFELITPQNHYSYGVKVSKQALNHNASRQRREINWGDFETNERLAISEPFMHNLRFLLKRLLRQATVLPGSKLQYDMVMITLLDILQNQHPRAMTAPSYKRRKQVVDRVTDYLVEHKERPISITELCNSVGASRRTLQYSFESIVGVSPIQYLRATRLNGVRRSLHETTTNRTVADVAADWGFLHLSQFSKDYRELFGERPSDTREPSHTSRLSSRVTNSI